MNAIYAVVQVDWAEYEYVVTVHKTYTEAWEQLVEIYNDRKADRQFPEVHEQNYISGEGWEAHLSTHSWKAVEDLIEEDYTAEDFKRMVGREPAEFADELERLNCKLAGAFGHRSCGYCEKHDKPRFICGCTTRKPEKDHEAFYGKSVSAD